MSLTIRPTALGVVLLSALLLTPTAHAEDDKRSAQLREAARRAQQQLQQAQQELNGIKAERDKLAAQEQSNQQALAAEKAQSRGQAATLRASLDRAKADGERLQGDLKTEQTQREALAKELEATQTKLQTTSQTLDEQRRITQAVTALLERSVKALASAEEANRQLHALGLKAVTAYTQATPEAMRAHDEPFLGLAAVRLDNEAEELRRDMANQRIAPQ
jgi:chromosome segregation ATPase